MARSSHTAPRPWGGLRSPLVPLASLVVQQLLHRRGANTWLSFPFHLIALGWLALVSVSARHVLSRIGGAIAVVGGTLNTGLVALSGGMMPFDVEAWQSLHIGEVVNRQRMHVAVDSGWRHFFGDRIPIAAIKGVVSIGDLFLAGGALLALAGFIVVTVSNRSRAAGWRQT